MQNIYQIHNPLISFLHDGNHKNLIIVNQLVLFETSLHWLLAYVLSKSLCDTDFVNKFGIVILTSTICDQINNINNMRSNKRNWKQTNLTTSPLLDHRDETWHIILYTMVYQHYAIYHYTRGVRLNLRKKIESKGKEGKKLT